MCSFGGHFEFMQISESFYGKHYIDKCQVEFWIKHTHTASIVFHSKQYT